jgi:C-terminal processing protease CtpA/Prc
LREWYLFPETLVDTVDPAPFSTVSDYLDALTATARAQGRDRYFTHITSIEGEDAYYASGDTAGFGIRLQTDLVAKRAFFVDVYDGSPAELRNLKRGAELIAIGETPSTMRSVADILTAEGEDGLAAAFGQSVAGVRRELDIRPAAGAPTARFGLVKANFSIQPVSMAYGVKVIEEGGERIAYVNLRTFIGPAENVLRSAFDNFRRDGITKIIIDLRYNGGGLVRTAEVMGDLLGGNRGLSDLFSSTRYRASKSSNDETRHFRRLPESASPTKLAFIVTGESASASELVVNAMTPWLRENSAIIGANTYGKPVGQIALDRRACDDRLRVVAFATENADRQGDYFDGLAGKTGASCSAPDDITRPMGDPQEGSTRQALDFLQGKSCTPISTGARAQSAGAERSLASPRHPTVAQRDVPGSF